MPVFFEGGIGGHGTLVPPLPCYLQSEPAFHHARFMGAMVAGTVLHPLLVAAGLKGAWLAGV
jgi:hypothetical protein